MAQDRDHAAVDHVRQARGLTTTSARPLELAADCTRCVGLCCVLPGFTRSADFALTKPPGQACPHLAADFRCGIHAALRQNGFAGCTVYDCFGAGQHLAAAVDDSAEWRASPVVRQRLLDRFPVVRQLHELAWYVDRALAYGPGGAVEAALREALTETERLASSAADGGSDVDVEAHRDEVNSLLVKASETLRAAYGGRDLRGAELVGADLRRRDLRGASLRGAVLVGARLDRADLTGADLTGADVRGARLHGADLAHALFLHPWQVTSADGDRSTALPEGMARPAHWV